MHISEETIDLAAAVSAAHDVRAGAVVMFSGEVRNHHHGKEVLHLEYEVFAPLAEKLIAEIVAESQKKWPLYHAACVHRVGRVNLGESAIVVMTSSAHRRDAYEANQYIVDRVKHEAPIWKREFFADGTQVWVEQCAEVVAHDSSALPQRHGDTEN